MILVTEGRHPGRPDTQASRHHPVRRRRQSQEPTRGISDPKDVAQLVMMRIGHINSKKDELTIAVKALAHTAKQLVTVYAKQQAQIAKLAKKVEELEKAGPSKRRSRLTSVNEPMKLRCLG